MALSAGTRLGPYEIGAQIGVGGMGEVYRAIDTHLGRPVAIKILPDGFANDPERLARFEREAKTLATLNHTNIAQIYGFEKTDGVPAALVMELVEGETLADRIARGPVPLDEALSIARQIAEALETAHEQGIVHRDLKPANVKVRADGAVKVLDFGLAKLADPASSSNVGTSLSPTLSLNATMAGVILGTASYMAPEQARGRPVDKRADIWAFGVVLYEMITASQLFPGDDVSHVLAKVIDREPDWSQVPAAVPSSIRTCLQRCLVKDPRQRMRDIGDVRLLLDGAFETPASSTLDLSSSVGSRSAPLWRRLLPTVALSVLLAGLAGLAAWIILRPGPSPVSRFELTTPADGVLAFSSRSTLAVASDGTVAYASPASLYLRRSGDIDPVPIRGTEARDLSTPFFSPDGTSIGFIEGFARPYTLKRVPVLGGTPTTIAQMPFPNYGATWASGNMIVVGTEEGLRRINANVGSIEPLTRVSEKFESHRWPSVLPDGRHVLFTVWLGSLAASQLAVASLETGNVTRLGLNGSSPRYSPTGHLVYAAGSTLRAVGFNATRLAATNENHVITVLENVYYGPTGVAYFGIANNGSLVYFTSPPVSGRTTLALVNTAGQAQPIGAPGTGYNYPRVARTGRWVAYEAEYTDGTDIAIFEIGGTTAPSRLTFGGKSRYPVWTADSRRVIFQSTRDGDAGLFWQPSDGTGTAERLTTAGKDESHIPDSATADGAWLTYTVGRGKVSELWRLSLTTKKTESLIAEPNVRVTQSVVSPDGRWIAYQSTETGNEEIFVQPFPPSGAKYLVPPANDNHHPIWAPDGGALYYVPGPRLFARLPITTAPRFGFGTPEPLDLNREARTGGPGQLRRLDIMPDGKRFVGLWPDELGNKATTDNERRIIVIENWSEELKRLMKQ